ncbi:hypothetical protein D3C76_1264760 [compost metagenome]
MPVVFKRLVFTPGGSSKIVHGPFDVIVHRVIPGVGGLTGLEIGVRVGGGAANDRMLRIQGTGAVVVDLRLRH